MACTTHKNAAQNTSEIPVEKTATDYFIISQGGGFTGAYETFLVQKDGTIIQLKNQNDSTLIGQMAPEIVDSLFNALPNLVISDRAISPPGNMNYAIITFINGTKNTVTWADAAKPNEAILSFYTFALLEVKKPR